MENRSVSLEIQVSRQMLAIFTTLGFKEDALAAAVRNGFNLEADAPLTRETAAEILYRAWQMENELIAKA